MCNKYLRLVNKTGIFPFFNTPFYICFMALLKRLLLLLLIAAPSLAFAQEKEAGQLDDLYQKQAYEKCLKKAEKYAADYPNQYQFPLYLSVCHYQGYKTGNQTSDLLLSLEQLQLAQRIYGKKISKFAAEQKQIHKAAIKVGPNLLKNGQKDDAKLLYAAVATVFKDTVEEYWYVFPRKEQPALEPVVVSSLPNKVVVSEPQPVSPLGWVNDLLEYSKTFLGLPYKYAGVDPSTGFDCSGFVSFLFKQFNVNLPRSSSELSKVGTPIPLKEVRPADLLFYGYKKNGVARTTHVALVISNINGHLSFIHSSSRGIVIDDPTSSSWDYWTKRFLFAKRVI